MYNSASLLKNPFVELYGEEKRYMLLWHDADSHYFGKKTCYFALFKTEQFSFSTGWSHYSYRRIYSVSFWISRGSSLEENTSNIGYMLETVLPMGYTTL